MKADPVRAIAEAVLYEGYLLWPYRRSALKNRQRFTFGGIYPAAFAAVGGDRSQIRMECLLEAGPQAAVEVSLRFLHLVTRTPLRRTGHLWEPVDELWAGGERHVAWEEAIEREFTTGERPLNELSSPTALAIDVAAGEAIETLDPSAALRRRWEAVEGTLAATVSMVGPGLVRLSVEVANTLVASIVERHQALPRSLLSAHLVARCRDAAFVSQTDPPAGVSGHAQACRNDGVWPVLAGEPGERDTLLGSPIILSDYPSVAPESPGDLFDGGEIDALLIHSIRALTDDEQDEMRATDPRAREILDRSLGLSSEQMLRLYGAVRDMRRVQS